MIDLSYKSRIDDMKNLINFKIFKFLFKDLVNVQGFDLFIEENIKTKYQLIRKKDKKNNYEAILFLLKHNKFKKEYEKLSKKFNGSKILDLFKYYI